jgi:AraC family transcriptional regulator of adaptative response / methylphosphotriester-DNA alkyltransferase methyltransferase
VISGAIVRRTADMQRPLTVQTRSRLYAQAVTVIMREYATQLSVDDVARRLFCSRRQLQRVFLDAGTSFRTVCRQARMAAARKLLRARPDMTVREVAHAVGYRQPAQFAKAFRREAGVSPAEYRAMAQAREMPTTAGRAVVFRARIAYPAQVADAASLEQLVGVERVASGQASGR